METGGREQLELKIIRFSGLWNKNPNRICSNNIPVLAKEFKHCLPITWVQLKFNLFRSPPKTSTTDKTLKL
jgi:hypothetical protein